MSQISEKNTFILEELYKYKHVYRNLPNTFDKIFCDNLEVLKVLILISKLSRNNYRIIIKELYKYKYIYKNLLNIIQDKNNQIKKEMEEPIKYIKTEPIRKKKVSLIIPYRENGQQDRLKIATWCFKRYKQLFPESEIVLSDSGDRIFSRGASINKGVDKCSGNYLIILDSDYLFSAKTAKELINDNPWTVISKSINYYFLDEFITTRILDMSYNIRINNIQFLEKHIQQNPFKLHGGVIGLPKNNYIKFDETFMGYGYEDNVFNQCMTAYYGKPYRTNNKFYHLNHKRLPGEYMQKSYTNKNNYDTTWKPIVNDFSAIQKLIISKGLK